MSNIEKIIMRSGYHSTKKYFQVGKDVFVQDRVDKEKCDHRNRIDGEGAYSFRKISKKEYDGRIEKLSQRLKDEVDTAELMRQTLYDCSLQEIEAMEKELKKKKPKVKAEKGCVALMIGKNQLLVRE